MPAIDAGDIHGPEPPAVVVKGWSEPALIVSTIVAALEAIFAVAVALGFDLNDGQPQAVVGAVAPCVALTLLVGYAIRQMVTPAEKAKAKIDQAYYSRPTIYEKPALWPIVHRPRRDVFRYGQDRATPAAVAAGVAV